MSTSPPEKRGRSRNCYSHPCSSQTNTWIHLSLHIRVSVSFSKAGLTSSGVIGKQGTLSAADSKTGSGGSGGSAGPGATGDGEGGPEEKARIKHRQGPSRECTERACAVCVAGLVFCACRFVLVVLNVWRPRLACHLPPRTMRICALFAEARGRHASMPSWFVCVATLQFPLSHPETKRLRVFLLAASLALQNLNVSKICTSLLYAGINIRGTQGEATRSPGSAGEVAQSQTCRRCRRSPVRLDPLSPAANIRSS